MTIGGEYLGGGFLGGSPDVVTTTPIAPSAPVGVDSSVMVPHFLFPFQLNGSAFAVVEQDTPQEIQQCVEVLLQTPTGSRLVSPDYGTPETLFTQLPVNVPAILAKLNKWEPRAIVTLQPTLNTIDQMTTYIRVKVTGGVS